MKGNKGLGAMALIQADSKLIQASLTGSSDLRGVESHPLSALRTALGGKRSQTPQGHGNPRETLRVGRSGNPLPRQIQNKLRQIRLAGPIDRPTEMAGGLRPLILLDHVL